MPVLNSNQHDLDESGVDSVSLSKSVSRRLRAFPVCANPHCASGWLQLWRNRRVPVLEGGWLCSPACTRARVEQLLRRETADAGTVAPHRHRVPIGLVLLRRGWIEHQDLKDALEAQRGGSKMRLGEWLMANRGLSESRLTQALGLQWGCPVFSLEKHGSALPVTVIPRLLPESFGFVPIRLSPAGRIYMGFEHRIDHSVALAVERMTGLQAELGFLRGAEFEEAQRGFAAGRFPRARLIEAGSAELLIEALARQIEKEKPQEARLVRVHDLFWLRMWKTLGDGDATVPMAGDAEDVIGSITLFA